MAWTRNVAVFLFLCLVLLPLRAIAVEDSGFEGLVIERVEHGKRIFSIEAAKAKFANKRIGFFELGIAKVILLEDADFTLYENGEQLEKRHFKVASYEPASRRLLDEAGNVIFVFK
ncbi:MAG: hypothetical protein Q8O22_06920 [Candidatus Omnitrophota bacterium]|nr:hypothetical protein [Candidatus Omnitrophota bacterium]